jgi:prefoldin alpha subunit
MEFNQQQIMQIQIIEQEANHLNQQIQLIDQNVSELKELKASLEEIDKSETREILVNIGKKVYLSAEIKDKRLIVDVGSKNFIRKSAKDTGKIIDGQINRLSDGKNQIMEQLESLQSEINNLLSDIEKSRKKDNKKGKN